MKFSGLSPASRIIWAKSGDSNGHGLLAHMLDVAAVVETLLNREPLETRKPFPSMYARDASERSPHTRG